MLHNSQPSAPSASNRRLKKEVVAKPFETDEIMRTLLLHEKAATGSGLQGQPPRGHHSDDEQSTSSEEDNNRHEEIDTGIYFLSQNKISGLICHCVTLVCCDAHIFLILLFLLICLILHSF